MTQIALKRLTLAAYIAIAAYALSGCSEQRRPDIYMDAPQASESQTPDMGIANRVYPEPTEFTAEMYFGPTYKAATVRARLLNLREDASLNSPVAARLTRGQGVKVYEISANGWCLVITEDGSSGWAWAPLLDIEGRKFTTAKYRGMTLISASRNSYIGPDGARRSRMDILGIKFRPPLRTIQLTSRFGIRKVHPVNGGHNLMHQGVDLLARVGTTVRSAGKGVVKKVGWGRSYGNYIDIDHGYGYVSRYAHLKIVYVKKGQHVRMGAPIARSGNTGATTGPHLHFELRKKGVAVNPSKYIRRL